jgi:hypothetical protein
MAMAMLITTVSIGLSAVLAAVMAVQTTNTRRALQAGHALDAAQAGLDVAMAHIRAANDGTQANGSDRTGQLASLPCGSVVGSVGAGSSATYTVAITYQSLDGADLACTSGAGPASVPAFATLAAVGGTTVTAMKRTLYARYTFQSTSDNRSGGLIHVYEAAGSKQLCLDAGSANPAVNAAVTVQLCAPGADRQTFAYTGALRLMLVSSVSGTAPSGMCLDAGAVPHAENTKVSLQACVGTARQQWIFSQDANIEGTVDGKQGDGFCFHVQGPDAVGSMVFVRKVNGSCGTAYNITSSFSPDAQVGAGSAGPGTGQVASYGQFSRCIDVPDGDVAYQYMIVWPCTQTSDPATVPWKQTWTTPARGEAVSAFGHIQVQPPAAPSYCLRSPGTNTANSFVKLVACPVGVPAGALKWTTYGNTNDYATSYRIMDEYGNCLAVNDARTGAGLTLHSKGQQVGPLVTVACSGATTQKWNANPQALEPSPLRDVREK